MDAERVYSNNAKPHQLLERVEDSHFSTQTIRVLVVILQGSHSVGIVFSLNLLLLLYPLFRSHGFIAPNCYS